MAEESTLSRDCDQRERFGAAAVGFCLKHSEVFRQHFWEKVCRTAEDPKRVPLLKIEVEPVHWADLRLTMHSERGELSVWVIEIKAGAPLDERQDPTSRTFFQSGVGYGALFAAFAPDARKSYVVLGASEDLSLKIPKRVNGIILSQRDWSEFLTEGARCTLFEDLVQTLGKAGVEPFSMEQAKKIAIKATLGPVGDAWQVLEEVCKWLGARKGYREFEAYTEDDGLGVLGVYIRQPPAQKSPSKLHQALSKATGSAGERVAWLGYMNRQDGSILKSVWLYCRNTDRRARLLKHVVERFPSAREYSDSGEIFVIVDGVQPTALIDFDWFRSVLEHVCNATAKPALALNSDRIS